MGKKNKEKAQQKVTRQNMVNLLKSDKKKDVPHFSIK